MTAGPTGVTPRPPLTVMGWLRFDAIRRAVAAVGPRCVIELGCGEGAMAAWFARRAAYVGVEPDDASRAVARERIAGMPGATVVESIDSVTSGPFDLACSFDVIEHIEDDAAALGSLAARVRPGGGLVVSVPAHPSRFGAADALVGHHRRYTRATLDTVITGAGFRVDWIESYGFGLGHALDRVQQRLAARRIATVPEATATVGTGGSGRFRQPESTANARVRAALAAPFRIAQRPFATTDHGVGYVAFARRTDGPTP